MSSSVNIPMVFVLQCVIGVQEFPITLMFKRSAVMPCADLTGPIYFIVIFAISLSLAEEKTHKILWFCRSRGKAKFQITRGLTCGKIFYKILALFLKSHYM